MHTPAQVAKHPIHPMLVPIPIGLWIFSLVCDLAYAAGWGGEAWRTVAFYTLAGGIVGALVAAIPGVIDLLSLLAVSGWLGGKMVYVHGVGVQTPPRPVGEAERKLQQAR